MKINKEKLKSQMAEKSYRLGTTIKQVINLAWIDYPYFYICLQKWEMWKKTLKKLERIGFDTDSIIDKF